MKIISCENVSKIFKRHAGQQLLRQHIANLFRHAASDVFYALQNVTFSVQAGESLGICGNNGAGKSTLLNLLTGLGRPEKGKISVNGRVAALLELGSGFHPDLTGAENLRINASLLGFSRKATNQLYEAIVDFSGIRESMNEPLRTYSSGMALRLAFSIAINVNPDILIVDEILAVGDQNFQAKCQDRIRLLRQRGTTFVCASHSQDTLLDLCDNGIWLDHGKVVLKGRMRDVVNAYKGDITAKAR